MVMSLKLARPLMTAGVPSWSKVLTNFSSKTSSSFDEFLKELPALLPVWAAVVVGSKAPTAAADSAVAAATAWLAQAEAAFCWAARVGEAEIVVVKGKAVRTVSTAFTSSTPAWSVEVNGRRSAGGFP